MAAARRHMSGVKPTFGGGMTFVMWALMMFDVAKRCPARFMPRHGGVDG